MKRDIQWWHIIALVIIIAGVFLTIWTAQQQDQRLRTELLTKANIATENIDPSIVETLNGSSSDIASPDYQYLKAKMARIRGLDPSIRFAYLMGQRPDGRIFFYVDSEPADSNDYSPPGQEYPEVTARILKAFSEKEAITEGPYIDRWGTWVSAIIPITDQKTGQLTTLFGMDVDARYWDFDIARACATIISAFLLILFLVVSFGLMQQRHNKREEQRLTASEDKFSRAFQTNPALMAVSTNEEGRFVEVNASFLKTLGYSREEVIGRTQSELGLYHDVACWEVIQAQLKENGQVRDVDVNLIRKNGETMNGSFSAIMIDVAGSPCLLMVILDITERKQYEEALRESEERYRSLYVDSRDAIMIVSPEMGFLAANPAAIQLFACRDEQDFTTRAPASMSPEYQPDGMLSTDKSLEMMRLAMEKGSHFFEWMHQRVDKTEFLATVLLSRLENEHVHLLQATVRDITEIKQVEVKLQQSEEKFRGIFDTINDGIHIHEMGPGGKPGKFIEVNEVACRMLQYTREELMEHGPLDFVTGYHNRPIDGIIGELAETGHSIFETGHRRKDGTIVQVEINSHLVNLLGKRMAVSVVRDITERKRVENTLLRVNQKLNVLSQMTRQDLTTQIFSLNSYLELAKKQATGQDRILETIQKGKQAAGSINVITEITKDYQDMGSKPPKWQNVKMAMLFGLSHIPLGEGTHSIETGDLEIFADLLLEKAFQRLFESSLTHGVHVTHTQVWYTVTPDDLTIFFEDNGIGIPYEKKEQIFLRSEGAARISRGSLIFVGEILDITGITIRETGEPGKGARFEIAVPEGAWRMAGKSD